MTKFIKNVWKDPVWSKVIAAGVVAIVAGICAYSNSGSCKEHVISLMSKELSINYVAGLVSVLVLIALIIWIIIQNQALYRKSQTEQLNRGELIYDVFISSPMASISGENEFQSHRDNVVKFKDYLRTYCGFSQIYDAGENMETQNDFDLQDISAKENIEALVRSKYFILIYPEKITSSVIFEAGIALSYKIPCIYFIKNTSDLPFLMQNLNHVFPYIRIYKTKNIKAMCSVVKNNGMKLFANVA